MSLENELKKYIDTQFVTPESPIYHTTDKTGYEGIIDSKYLKLNSHRNLNQKNPQNDELQPGIKLIKSNLKKIKELKISSQIFNEYTKKGIIFYTCSFSKQPLKKYGDFYFEFDVQPFSNLQKSLFANVEYRWEKQEEIISGIFEIYEKFKKEPDATITLFTYLTIVMPLLKKFRPHAKDEECRLIRAEIFDPDDKLITESVPKQITFLEKHILNHGEL